MLQSFLALRRLAPARPPDGPPGLPVLPQRTPPQRADSLRRPSRAPGFGPRAAPAAGDFTVPPPSGALSSASSVLARRIPSFSPFSVPCVPSAEAPHYFRRAPRPQADRAALSLSLGASPFDVALTWRSMMLVETLSPSAVSAWRQFGVCCSSYSRPVLPISVISLTAYMLWYVCVKLNSSANLGSELAHLRSFCVSQSPPIQWPDFEAASGDSQSKHISMIQKAYPAEIRPAPALTLRFGLARAIRYLRTLLPNLWAQQWIALLSCMHDMVLRPGEIIPSDKFSPAPGYFGGFAYPRLADFTFVSPDAAQGCAGGLLYVTALTKTQQEVIDSRMCTVAAVNQLPGATVDASRDLREYLEAAKLSDASPDTPVFYYRSRDGSLKSHSSRAALLYEFRRFILVPAGVDNALSFTLRSLRPGGATDLAAAGVPESVVRKIGKWTAETGMVPYNRVDHHLLHSLSQHRSALLSVQ